MAANYSATIQLIVEGQQKLDKLQGQVTALNKQIKELARLDIGGIFEDPLMGGAVAKLRAARNEQVATLKQTGQQQDAVNRKLENQLLNQIRLNSAVDLYKRRINEVSRTAAPEQTQFKGRLQELEQAFQFFKGKGSVQGVQAVATELGRIVEYSREVTRLELGRAKSSQQVKDYVAQIEKLKAAGLNTLKAEVTLDKLAVNAGTNKYQLAEKYKVVLDSRIKRLNEELRLQQQLAIAEAKRSRETGGRIGGAISSAVIGGGFPLLFGQGPAAAAGGAIGGLAGGLVGGGFGFALSIAGTALGDAAEKADAFNKQLAVLNANIVGTSSSAKITSKDVQNLAKALGIASDEAIKLLGNFAGFNNANITKALAFVYGDDPATLKSLAAVKDKADLAQVILGSYEKITIETANQLINQLKLGDAATVELAFQKALLDAKVKQTEEGLKQITIQDRIVALLQTAANFTVGGTQQVVDPAIFGKGRVAEFRRNNPISPIFTNALQGVQQLRTITQGAQTFRPDRGAAKAARDAERERERVAQVVRDRNAEADVLRLQAQLQEKIAAAELKKDPILVARLQGEERILEIQYQYAQALAGEKNVQAQIAITNAGRAAINKQRVINEIQLNAIYAEREKLIKNTLDQLDTEIAIKYATTDAERARLRIEQEIADLRKQGITDETVLAAIAARKAELAKPVLGADLIRQQIGGLSDELTKLIDVGTQVTQIAENIGTSFANSFKGLVSGAMTAQEALSSFFQSVADRFLDMAAQIIAKWIEMSILNSVLNLFPGGNLVSKGTTDVLANFNAAVLQYRAAGGPVSAGSPYMVGERGPELFVPGRSGTIVPNNALSAGGTTSVVVNVDAGASNVQGNDAQASQLGKVIGLAVQQELIKQKRPGGLLS